jgi:methylated-DNA-[protein]-cysteine S-methyltransferase
MKARRQPTVTESRVYETVTCIPRGMVSTYGAVARAIGLRSARAVGQALRRNPFAPRVPCHRVIASDLTPGGFAGQRTGPEIQRKLALLEAEGVRFNDNGRLADSACLFYFGNRIPDAAEK